MTLGAAGKGGSAARGAPALLAIRPRQACGSHTPALAEPPARWAARTRDRARGLPSRPEADRRLTGLVRGQDGAVDQASAGGLCYPPA
jgi:hypothetical protein